MCGVGYKRRRQRRERAPEICLGSPWVVGWTLSYRRGGWDSTNVGKGHLPGAVRWTHCTTHGWEIFKFWPAIVKRTHWTHVRHSVEISESSNLKTRAQLDPACFVHIRSPHFRQPTTKVAFLLPPSSCFSVMSGCTIRLGIASGVFLCAKAYGLSEWSLVTSYF